MRLGAVLGDPAAEPLRPRIRPMSWRRTATPTEKAADGDPEAREPERDCELPLHSRHSSTRT